MRLTKHHGLGNDFLVLTDPDGAQQVDAALARAVCDRHRGVGADGLLHLGPGADGADVSMVLLNADGGRAEMSGNGIGCLVQAAVLSGLATGPAVSVSTDAGERTVEIRPGEAPRTHMATVAMGVVEVADDDEPEWCGPDVLRARRVAVGNPHLVLHAAAGARLDDRSWVAELGRRANELTPGGVNLEVVAVDEDDGSLRMDVYERGVGLTLACGTGAVAAVAAAQRWGVAGDIVTVHMVGGPTRIDLGGPEARMTTPITYVAAVELPHPVSLIEREIREKIVLVGVALGGRSVDDVDAALDELSLLVDTAGADEVARVVQRRDAPDPKYFIGKGKAEELKEVSLEVDSDTVVFDDELTPAQQFNLEKLLGRTAIDRTAVILDIFAQNASSQEGKAQVELALLRYRLPRLRGRGKALSQQAGGMSAAGGARIGSRGPGETQLEVDRRRIQRRIAKLERDLKEISRHRDTQRKGRSRSRLQHVAIVGYTNAGKSTLLNRLTDAGVLVEDRLFATLDATTRRLELPGGERVLCTDTVGFIRKLPHGLVEAFKSTLEVVNEADLLIQVVDASSHDPGAEMAAVREVLMEIGADRIPELVAFNKLDRAGKAAARLVERHPGSVAISALTGTGVDVLLRTIGDRLRALSDVVELVVPYERGDVLAAVHREGEVVSESHEEGGIRVRARLDEAGRSRFTTYELKR